MKSRVACLLAIVQSVLAATYYVESAPVAPFSCTVTRPCRLQDLPSTYTTADSVIFVPATTGTSSTFASGSKSFNKPSVTLSAGLTFSAFSITVASANSLTCTGTVSITSGSTVATANVATVSSNGCNVDNSQFNVQAGTTVSFRNAAVTGMSSTRRIQLQGTSITVDTVTFTSGSTTQPALVIVTGNADSTVTLNAVDMNGITTSSGNSLIQVLSTNGKALKSSGAQYVSFTNCVSGAGLLELRVGAGGASAFSSDFGVVALSASGSSASQGVYYVNSLNSNSALAMSIEQTSSTGTNFNSGNVITLSASSGSINVDGFSTGANSFCSGSNEAYLVGCAGNSNIRLKGDTDGTTATNGCGTLTQINMGSSC